MPSVKKAAFWSYMIQFSQKGLGFVITIILARILNPEIFGTMAMALIVVAISQTIKDFGMGMAIIQNRNMDKEKYSSVFFFNLFMGSLLTIIIYLIAPVFDSFFRTEELTKIIRPLSLIFIIGSLGSVPRAILNKELKYNLLIRVTTLTTILSGATAIIMAIEGYGIWSLVVQNMLKSILGTITVISISGWLPKWHFRFSEIKNLMNFSLNILGTHIVAAFLSKMNQILIGRFFPAAQLGLFKKARGLRRFPEEIFYLGMTRISFPLFSKHQDDDQQLRNYMNRMQQLLAFAFCPTMIFIFVLAEPLVLTLLGPKWIDSVLFLRFLAAAGIFAKISDLNHSIIISKGSAGFLFRFNIFEGIISTGLMIIIIQEGMIPFLIFILVRNYIRTIIRFYFGQKFIKLTIYQQLKNIFPYFSNSMIAGVIIYLINYVFVIQTPLFSLIVGIFSGSLIYFILTYIQNLEAIKYLKHNLQIQINKI